MKVVGFAGYSGSGKTSLLNTLAMQVPASKRLSLRGRGLHSFSSELNLRIFGNTSLTSELNLSTLGTHPRVNLGYTGDKVSLG